VRYREGEIGMRHTGMWALLLVGALASAALADDASPDATRTAWLIGTWSCRSNAGSTGRLKYVRNSDGSLSGINAYAMAGGGGGEFTETFRFDRTKNRWTWIAMQPDGTIVREFATAPPWTTTAWIFEGTFNALGPNGPHRSTGMTNGMLHMVYTAVDDTTFSRSIETHGFGPASGTSTSLCTRMPA
jgi:hypothetical protein